MLKSAKGQGTTAELWLPIAAQAAEPVEPVPLPTPEPQAPVALKVLAVDDDPLVLMTIAAMLEDLGCDVVEASSAEQALDVLAQQKVQLVLTDQAMPHMTGSQLAEVIRHRYPALPVILATGYADKLSGAAGRLPRLGKPFDQATLAQRITSVMNHP